MKRAPPPSQPALFYFKKSKLNYMLLKKWKTEIYIHRKWTTNNSRSIENSITATPRMIAIDASEYLACIFACIFKHVDIIVIVLFSRRTRCCMGCFRETEYTNQWFIECILTYMKESSLQKKSLTQIWLLFSIDLY